jgi:hypothetical protein
MAFNQASLFLFPPRFTPVVRADESEMADGKPVKIVDSSIADPSAGKVLTAELRQWFMERGFHEEERYGAISKLWRTRQNTWIGTQGEIELSLPLEEEEITELYMRFLLTKQTPDWIPQWKKLVCELGHDFGFRLMDEEHRLLPCVDFLTVVTENWNFRTFAQQYGWEY